MKLNERGFRSLSIYPAGNKKRDGQDHVSIYLELMDQSSLPVGWEVNAIVNFSVYNFLEDEYVTTQGTNLSTFTLGILVRFVNFLVIAFQYRPYLVTSKIHKSYCLYVPTKKEKEKLTIFFLFLVMWYDQKGKTSFLCHFKKEIV